MHQFAWLLVSWSTLVDLFNWFCLSSFIPAYLSVRFGVWLYQPIWFIISHQCCGADRILTPRGPVCFFHLDIALVPVSSHGTSNILPCETVRITCFQLMLILAEYMLLIIGYYAVHTFGCTHILIVFIYMEIIIEMIYKPHWLNGTAK